MELPLGFMARSGWFQTYCTTGLVGKGCDDWSTGTRDGGWGRRGASPSVLPGENSGTSGAPGVPGSAPARAAGGGGRAAAGISSPPGAQSPKLPGGGETARPTAPGPGRGSHQRAQGQPCPGPCRAPGRAETSPGTRPCGAGR